MEQISSEQLLSKTISYLRFPLAVGIVYIHNQMDNIDIQGINGGWENFGDWPSVKYTVMLFSNVLPRIAVPLFFIFSGYFFFKSGVFNWEIYKSKISRRKISLMVPYLFWNFVGFLILLVQYHPRFAAYFPKLQGTRIDISSFLNCFCNYVDDAPIDGPMWYVRDLMILCLMSPVIYWLIKKLKFIFVLLVGCIWFFSLGYEHGLPYPSHQGVFFFPLGAYFSINGINFVERINKSTLAKYCVLISPLLIALDVLFCTNNVTHKVWIIVGSVAILYIVSSLVKKNVREHKLLTDFNFFLFSLHYLIINKFMKMLVMFLHPSSPPAVLIIYFTVPVVVILLCLALYIIMRKYTPSFLKVINGGR